ncbi:MAG TPA: BrnT family toxin [Nitrospira sp.]|nr:BrnT family toxin [Nitrospira sp.]
MKLEWDPRKAESNLRKHGVSFDEAGSVFLDRLALSGPDPDHSLGEVRYITFGMSRLGRLLVLSHTNRPDAIRIINARRMTRSERKIYEEG